MYRSIYSCIDSFHLSIHLLYSSIYLSGVATMRGCVATRCALPPHRAAMECCAGRDGTTRPRRRPRLRPTQSPSAPEYPLSTLRSSRPPSASLCVRESAAAQPREPERATLRPTRPREYPPSTRRAPAAVFAWSAWAAREYLWSTSKAAVRGSSAFPPRQSQRLQSR